MGQPQCEFLPPLSGEFVDGLGRSVSGMNVWLEHSHRLLAGLLALQVAGLLIWALVAYRRVPSLLWPTIGAAAAVIIQALLGALVVWNLVKVELVTTHLGLGTATMALLIYVAARAAGPLRWPADVADVRLWRFALVVTLVLWVQILVGGHLSGVDGGLAFKSDTALGVWSVGPITMEAEAVNVVHRYLAYVVAGLIMALGIRLKRRVGNAALTWIRIAAGLTVLQILLGVANLYSDLSFVSVIPHLAVASWLLAAMVMVVVRLSTPDDTPGAERPAVPRGADVGASA